MEIKKPIVYTIKSFNGRKFKLTGMFSQNEFVKKKRGERGKNQKKLDASISRTRSKIFEYAICNDFEYFVTMTIDPQKYNRKNLKLFYKDFSQFFRDFRKKYDIDVKYIMIPERHKDGSWHMHGLIEGIPEEMFVLNNNGYLDWIEYKKKFGYISLSKIRNQEACSKYITKYITKEMANLVTESNQKMYYSSRNLVKSDIIKKGMFLENIPVDWEFGSTFCVCKEIKLEDIDNIKNNIIDILPQPKKEKKPYIHFCPNLFDDVDIFP